MSSAQTSCDSSTIDIHCGDRVKHMESGEGGDGNQSEEYETNDYSEDFVGEDSSNEDSCDEAHCSETLDGSRSGENYNRNHNSEGQTLSDHFSIDDCSDEDCWNEMESSEEGCSGCECSRDKPKTENYGSDCGGEEAVNTSKKEGDALVGTILKGGCKFFHERG